MPKKTRTSPGGRSPGNGAGPAGKSRAGRGDPSGAGVPSSGARQSEESPEEEETGDGLLEGDADATDIVPDEPDDVDGYGEGDLDGDGDEDGDGDLEASLSDDLSHEDGQDEDEAAPPVDPVKRAAARRGEAQAGKAQVEVLESGAVREGRSLVRYDPLTAYIQEIRRYSLLSRDEETDLAVRYREEGDVDAARRLVTANLRLVVKIAHEYRKAHQNLLDLVQEGNIGLMQAVRKFDPYRGVKLSTYSSWWIRAYILKFILNNWRLVKIGTTQAQRKLFFNLRKQREHFKKMGIEPKASSIATALDVPEREVVEMERRLAAPELSLSTPVGRSESTSPRTFVDTIPTSTTAPDEQVAGAEFRELLSRKLERFALTLKGRDAVIYRERLMTDEPLTLKEIGDRYGITKERARQLEKRLLGKLREYLRHEMGDAVEVALGLET